MEDESARRRITADTAPQQTFRRTPPTVKMAKGALPAAATISNLYRDNVEVFGNRLGGAAHPAPDSALRRGLASFSHAKMGLLNPCCWRTSWPNATLKCSS
jgi:hypothetical protein